MKTTTLGLLAAMAFAGPALAQDNTVDLDQLPNGGDLVQAIVTVAGSDGISITTAKVFNPRACMATAYGAAMVGHTATATCIDDMQRVRSIYKCRRDDLIDPVPVCRQVYPSVK